MKARSVAVAIGLVAGIAAFLALKLNWAGVTAALHVGQAGIAADRTVQFAWAISAGTTVFAVATLIVALIAGLVETAKARRQIAALRHDPNLADRWNAADWRAAFTPTAVADHAEAMIALLPIDKGETRRVVVDTPILLGLSRIWLDRLTLSWTITPLAPLLLGLGATLALVAYASGGRWDAVAAAGTAGWFAIRLAQYLVRAVLAPLVDAAVADATAAIRPLSAAQAIDATRPAGPIAAPGGRIGQDEAEIIAAALSHVIWEPLGRLAEAAEKLSAAGVPQSRVQAIEEAMAEVRAGIERLLSNSGEG